MKYISTVVVSLYCIALVGCSVVHYSPQILTLNTDNPQVSIKTKSYNIQEQKEYEHEYTNFGSSDTINHNYDINDSM